MSETQLLTIAASLVATLFGLLILILGWLGNKLYERLGLIQSDLHTKINGLDRRVTVIEARCSYEHDRRPQA